MLSLDQIKQVIKTEHECVSRDCNRDCGNCDLVLEREDILEAYQRVIKLIERVESLKSEYDAYHMDKDYYWQGVKHSLGILNNESLLF